MDNSQETIQHFANSIESTFGDRLVSLVAYGSVINRRSEADSDIDFFLMLQGKGRLEKDIETLHKLVQKNSNVNIDMSLQYIDDQSEYPRNFHDGTKGTLALSYLSSAKLLKGKNIFISMLEKLSIEDYRESIKNTTGYYLDKMKRESIAKGFSDDSLKLSLKKYTSRSLIDAFLFTKKDNMDLYKGMKPDEIINLARTHNFTKDLIPSDFNDTPSDYLKLMEAIYNKIRAHKP